MRIYLLFAIFALLSACSSQRSNTDLGSSGQASWYGAKHHGKKTASGERFNQNALTAAHRTLAFGTRVKVTNTINNKSVKVRINDRGPYSKGRVIDLSRAAAKKINMIDSGVVPVRLQVLR
ncbi:MAG TPA: septal ring lytic transglycosylase RlpA family protein [Gammaproteobacteria bacterium]|nr:septal ring lytic transglycosylase RlpA family protein [Gammaproteobacteria bacterium]